MILFKYFTKEVINTLLATTIILMVLFITNQSLQFLNRAASGDIPATVLLKLIFLQVPLLLGYLLPLGLYLGVLLTLARFYLSSEMTIMHACGISRAQVTHMVLTIALAVALVVAGLTAFVVPKAQGDINQIIRQAEVSASLDKVIPGQFMSFGKDNNIIFYAAHIQHHSLLKDVFFAKKLAGKDDKWSIVVAKSAVEKPMFKQQGQYLIFNDGYRYVGVPGQKAVDKMHFKRYGFLMDTQSVSEKNQVQYWSLQKLWESYHQNINAAAEFQWRLALPISTLIFALLAVPLGEIKPRFGKFTQLFPAILIYIIYADLLFLTRSWIKNASISVDLGMWWVHLIPFCIALYLMGFKKICR